MGHGPSTRPKIDQFRDRLLAFITKAAREAKQFTSWLRPNESHERALRQFTSDILDPSTHGRFLPDFRRLQSRIAFHGALNSLSQVLLKIASPGNPDFYQGLELWDFSMTDPDNRSAVDFQRRAGLLESLQRPALQHLQLASLLHNWTDGRIKLFLTARALEFRRRHPKLFLEGDYLPLYAGGRVSPHVCAFMRGYKREKVLVAVPRFTTALTERGRFPLGLSVWHNASLKLTRAAARGWTDVLTGERVQPHSRSNRILLRDLFNQFPVALLYSS